jgi:glutamate carboxypeptidase
MERLYEAFQSCAKELGLDLKKRNTGGCCDGNNLHEFGLANLDTLGVRGGNIHSKDEFICLDSLVERSQLNGLFLLKLASNEIKI